MRRGITFGDLQVTVGFRLDHYSGLISKTGPEPRLQPERDQTVLRAAYARTFETPFNENLLLSSATGVGGLVQNVFGSSAVAISPGFHYQSNTGFQQAIGRYVLIDADYSVDHIVIEIIPRRCGSQTPQGILLWPKPVWEPMNSSLRVDVLVKP